jgi:hypothetical protein
MKSRVILRGILILVVAAGALSGCGGGDDLPRHEVTGTVTLNDKPLESGSIQFQPEESSVPGAAVSGGALISGGQYQIKRAEGLTPGSYKVMIFSHGDTPVDESAPPGEAVARGNRVPAELIPAQYNTATTLKVQVTADKANVLNFDLKK